MEGLDGHFWVCRSPEIKFLASFQTNIHSKLMDLAKSYLESVLSQNKQPRPRDANGVLSGRVALGRTLKALSSHPIECFAVVVYLVATTIAIHLPGPYYDETLFVNASLPGDDGSFIAWSVPFQNHRFPLMVMSYIGSVKAYLYAPLFQLFGKSMTTLRLPAVLIGLATLVLTHRLVNRSLGRTPALTTLVLLAFDPSFIFANKLDWGPVALGLLLRVSALHQLHCWTKERKARQLASAALLMGLGVYDKVTFLWFAVSASIAFPICFWREVRPQVRSHIARSVVWFFIGCLPLLVYNFRGPGRTFREEDILNKSPFGSFQEKLKLFRTTLGGEAIYQFINGESVSRFQELAGRDHSPAGSSVLVKYAALWPLHRTFLPEAFLASICIVGYVCWKGHLERRREVLFFLLLSALITLLLWLFEKARGAHHLLSLYPMPHILIGSALSSIPCLRKTWKPTLDIFSAATFGFLAACLLAMTTRYVLAFQIKGGEGYWSDAIYSLAQYTKEHPDASYQLMDWGFGSQLRLLGETSLRKTEAFRPIDRAGDETSRLTAMRTYIGHPGSLFLFHTPEREVFPTLDLFLQAQGKIGTKAELVKTFYQRDGEPVYLLYKTQHPAFDHYLETGGFFSLREAEEWDAQSGGSIEFKPAASQNKVLGRRWGQVVSDFATYRIDVTRKVQAGCLWLRYSVARSASQHFSVQLDDRASYPVALEPTGGDGNRVVDWRILKLRFEPLEPGTHHLMFKPAAAGQSAKLDWWAVTEEDAPVPW